MNERKKKVRKFRMKAPNESSVLKLNMRKTRGKTYLGNLKNIVKNSMIPN